MVKGQTFANQKIRPEDQAIINSFCAINDNGAIGGNGTEVLITNNGGVFNFGAGKILCQGRVIEIDQNSQIEVPLGDSSSITKGYIILKIDLSEEPPDLESDNYDGTTPQCFITYKEGSAGADFPSLVQNNLNDGGSIYELPLCSYYKTNTGFSNVTRTIKTLTKNNNSDGYVEKSIRSKTIEYTTTPPTTSPAEGTLLIYVGTTLPTTRYDRVLYLIGE